MRRFHLSSDEANINCCDTDLSYAVFASPDFDADDYANAILAGEPFNRPTSSKDSKIAKNASSASASSETAREDISVAISKLNVGLDDVSKQLRNEVSSSSRT